jgi:hypothetical protein
MQDAVAIRFISKQKRGVGTRFECDTKIWKLPLKDKLTITYWEDDYYMGVEHTGLVGGSGTFVLEPNGRGGTEFIWEEDLIFPWYFGGPVGALIARPVMTKVWRANLAALKHIVELAHS